MQDASDRVDWRTRIGFTKGVVAGRAGVRPNLGYSTYIMYCTILTSIRLGSTKPLLNIFT